MNKVIETAIRRVIVFIGYPVQPIAIKMKEARLCLNCESVIRESVCPVCGSMKQLMIGRVLGVLK